MVLESLNCADDVCSVLVCKQRTAMYPCPCYRLFISQLINMILIPVIMRSVIKVIILLAIVYLSLYNFCIHAITDKFLLEFDNYQLPTYIDFKILNDLVIIKIYSRYMIIYNFYKRLS